MFGNQLQNLCLFRECFLYSVSSHEVDADEEGGQVSTLLRLRKPPVLAFMCQTLGVLSMAVRKNSATSRVKRYVESARAANASIDIVDGVHCSILQLNISPRAPILVIT